MAKKNKYYVVWVGHFCGVFDNWNTCKKYVDGFEGAKYKSFESQLEAERAFRVGYAEYYRQNPVVGRQKPTIRRSYDSPVKPILESLSVDAACSGNPGVMEYQGVFTETGKLWFRKGPFQGASNNIGEFLALVHGLALLKQKNLTLPLYSDSITAIAWVRHKKIKSIIPPTDKNMVVFDLVQRAEKWLAENYFSTPIYKWDTKEWGEIPADFGRK